MSKLRTIIEDKMVAILPSESFSAPDEVIEQIKALMLELVGTDEFKVVYMPDPSRNEIATADRLKARDNLRRELRKSIKAL